MTEKFLTSYKYFLKKNEEITRKFTKNIYNCQWSVCFEMLACWQQQVKPLWPSRHWRNSYLYVQTFGENPMTRERESWTKEGANHKNWTRWKTNCQPVSYFRMSIAKLPFLYFLFYFDYSRNEGRIVKTVSAVFFFLRCVPTWLFVSSASAMQVTIGFFFYFPSSVHIQMNCRPSFVSNRWIISVSLCVYNPLDRRLALGWLFQNGKKKGMCGRIEAEWRLEKKYTTWKCWDAEPKKESNYLVFLLDVAPIDFFLFCYFARLKNCFFLLETQEGADCKGMLKKILNFLSYM